jgi:hypothetical protein
MVDILNTPFTLWLLSTVVVGSVTFLYKKFSVRIDENQAQKELVENMDAEISWRLYNARAFISSHDMDDSRDFSNGLAHLISTAGGSLYERFANMTLDKLIFTLYQTGVDTHPRELLHVLDQLQAIKNVPHARRSSAAEKSEDEEKKLLKEFMEGEITTRRWGTLH